MTKCPICNNNSMEEVDPVENNTGYLLISVNENNNPASVDLKSGFPVNLLACTSCGVILPFNKNIIKK